MQTVLSLYKMERKIENALTQQLGNQLEYTDIYSSKHLVATSWYFSISLLYVNLDINYFQYVIETNASIYTEYKKLLPI